jgi:hypothetical protein
MSFAPKIMKKLVSESFLLALSDLIEKIIFFQLCQKRLVIQILFYVSDQKEPKKKLSETYFFMIFDAKLIE